ncbi:hypothetical protein EDB19DRAFT_1637011 [Suillus lakei]|nr:hypothetical protein EDB19DRAFT_1637011 [Suillus lakei]
MLAGESATRLKSTRRELAPVAGWEPLVQPEGALIFYHPYNRVFTDVDARDPETAVKLGIAVEKAKEEAGNAEITLDPHVELALELITKKDGRWMWGYYFVDHKKRVIFWFEDHRSFELMNNVRGVERKSHVSEFFLKHIELFPNRRFLPKDVVLELKELVLFAQADGITSQTSLTRFTLAQIASILGLVDLLKGESFPDAGRRAGVVIDIFSDSTDEERVHSPRLVVVRDSHFLITFLGKTKFVNFCGQPGARLDVDQSLYEEPNAYSKNILFHIMNFILLGSPDAQSKAFRKILVDGNIVDQRWEQYMDKLNSEWNGYTIFSTVMLAVDISFLAVQSVQAQTPVILLSYMSTLCAMGSLVVTLLLVGQANKNLRGSRAALVSFLVGLSRSVFGFESFPLMLSLPFGLLIWGCVSGYITWVGSSLFGQNNIICCGVIYLDFLHSWCHHRFDCISDVGRHSRSSDVARNGCKLIFTLGPSCGTGSQNYTFPHLWHRSIEKVSRTATTPSHVV